MLFRLLFPEDMCRDSSQAGQDGQAQEADRGRPSRSRETSRDFDKVMGISRQILEFEATKPAKTGGAKILEKMKS